MLELRTLSEIFQDVIDRPDDKHSFYEATRATDYMLQRIEDLNEKLLALGINKKITTEYLASQESESKTVDRHGENLIVPEQTDTNSLKIVEASDKGDNRIYHEFQMIFVNDIDPSGEGLNWGDETSAQSINYDLEKALLQTLTTDEKTIIWHIFSKQQKEAIATFLQKQEEAIKTEIAKPAELNQP